LLSEPAGCDLLSLQRRLFFVFYGLPFHQDPNLSFEFSVNGLSGAVSAVLQEIDGGGDYDDNERGKEEESRGDSS
jgi:hypothetical protein